MKSIWRKWLTSVLAAGLAFSVLAAPDALAQSDKGKDKASEDAKEPKTPSEVPASRKILFQFDLYGELGREVSSVSMKQALEDAKKWKPDYLIMRVNMAFSQYGRGLADWRTGLFSDGTPYNQLETVRELQTMFTDGIRDDPNWITRDGKKPELVMWVKNAMGGAAFIPFVGPTIYYTSDAHHGGIGYLEFIFAGVGDYVAREKQYSLRLGRAEGLAIKGGHAPEIIRAMARMDYVLSVSYVGGKPVFYPNDPSSGDELLTDDGDPDAGRRDGIEDMLNFKGNDVLILDASKAIKLQLGKAIIDTNDDLVNELGVSRDYVIVKGRHDQIFKAWVKSVVKAEEELVANWREFQRTEVAGQTPSDRNKGRGKRLKLLRDIGDAWKKYGESINPLRVRGVPGPDDVEVITEQLKQQMRLDK